MSKVSISIAIGAVAGVVDIVPMVIQGLDVYATASAFIHWVVLGFLISHIQILVPAWLNGMIIAEMSALPIVPLVLRDDPLSVIPIVVMSALLGAAVGFSAPRFAR